MAAFTVSSTNLVATYTHKEGGGERTDCSLSPDFRKMTCRGSENDGKGHSADYVDVYDRH